MYFIENTAPLFVIYLCTYYKLAIYVLYSLYFINKTTCVILYWIKIQQLTFLRHKVKVVWN